MLHAVSFTLLLAASSAPAAPPVPVSASSALPSAAPSAGPSPSASPGSGPRDRALHLVGGVWQCDTVAGDFATHVYSENDDGSIEMQNELHAGFRTFRITETYRFDDNRKTWTERTSGGYTGTAAVWSGYKWTFEGVDSRHGRKRPVRLIYFDLGDQALRRDFQSKQGGVWQTYSAETCRRPSN